MEAKTALNILSLEDSPQDFEIIHELLIQAGTDVRMKHVETEKDFTASLRSQRFDIILADFKLPGFDAIAALRLHNEICPDIPFICVSGSIGEEAAVELLKLGAVDYVLKDRLVKLPFAIKRALDEAQDKESRQRTEAALRESEEIFRSFMEHSPIYVFFKDENIRAKRLSRNYETMLGKPIAELLGKNMDELFPSDLAKRMVADDANILKEGKEITVEEELNGRFYTTIKFPIQIEGKPRYLAGYTIDVTDRKQAEGDIRKLSRAVEQSPTSVIITDIKGNIEYVNPKFTQLTGYTLGDVEGKNPRLLKSDETSSEEYKHLWELITSGKEWHGQLHNRKKNGELYWEAASISPILDENGKTTHFLAVKEDITDRRTMENKLRESEEFYRTLINTSPDAVITTDTQSRIQFASTRALELFNIPPDQSILGRSIYYWVAPEDFENVKDRMEELLVHKLQPETREYKLLRNDRTLFYCDVSSSPLFDSQNRAHGILIVCRDVTEKKMMQGQLLQTQKVQSIGTLAEGIAHDFNNILGIILAFSSALEQLEGDKEKISKSTTAIAQAVARGAALVRQILTFARQTGVVVKPMLVPDLIREIVTMLKETFPAVIEFKIAIDNNVPFISADHSQMHQVLLNLCVNARDAMPKGGNLGIEVKTVTSETLVRQFPDARSDRYVSISVSDTGTGMDEATRSRIFDPFFTTKEQGKGTGLGLSVVYGVIQDHHGFISVESTVGQGTTFHLYIPVPQEEKKTQEINDTRIEDLQRGSETILFVEDEELLREVVQSALEANGYNVLIATNGREAVDIYKKQYKDIGLVLSDMGLPKRGGRDVYAMFKEINPNIKIIFASGFISLETRAELFKDGVQGFIMKPYRIQEVLLMVRDVLDEKGEKYEQHNSTDGS